MKLFVFGSNNGEGIIIEIEDWLCVVDSFISPSGCPIEELLNRRFPAKKKIDLLVVTHPHRDHYSGIENLVGSRSISTTLPFSNSGLSYQDFILKAFGTCYRTDEAVARLIKKETTPFGKFLAALRIAKEKSDNYVSAARTLPGGSLITRALPSGKTLNLRLAGPFEHFYDDAITIASRKLDRGELPLSTISVGSNSQNLYSTILDIRYDSKRLVLFADATNEMMKEFMETELGDEPIDLVKVAHHGSKEGGLPDFWAKIALQTKPCYSLMTHHRSHKLPTPSIKKVIEAATNQTLGATHVVRYSSKRQNFIEIDFSSPAPTFSHRTL